MPVIIEQRPNIVGAEACPSNPSRRGLGAFRIFAAHRFVKQFGQIILYLCASRVIAFLGNAWASRCLGPEKLGVSTMILATTGQMALFVGCSLDNLFIRRYKTAATEEARQAWVSVALAQRFFFSIILGLAGVAVALFFHIPAQWHLGIFAAFPGFVLTSIAPLWVNVAQEDVPANYKATAYSSILAAVLYLAFFRPGQAVGTDIIVQTIAMAAQFIVLSRTTLYPGWYRDIRWSRIRSFWPIFIEGKWLFASGLLIYVYTTLEVPMLGYLSTEAEVGKYGVAIKFVGVFQQVLTLAPLFLFPRFVEWRKKGIDYLWRKQLFLAGIILVASIPICAIVFLTAPFIFRVVYGAAFASAATPFAILFASKMVVVLNGLFAQGLWANEQDRKVFWILVPTALVSFAGNYLLLRRYGMFAACSMNLLSEVLVLIGCFVLARHHALSSTRSRSD